MTAPAITLHSTHLGAGHFRVRYSPYHATDTATGKLVVTVGVCIETSSYVSRRLRPRTVCPSHTLTRIQIFLNFPSNFSSIDFFKAVIIYTHSYVKAIEKRCMRHIVYTRSRANERNSISFFLAAFIASDTRLLTWPSHVCIYLRTCVHN